MNSIFKDLFLISVTLALLSCRNESAGELVHKETVKHVVPRPIDLYPYGNYSPALVKVWQHKLTAINPEVVVKYAVALPEFAFYQPRNRYVAIDLLKHLRSLNIPGRISVGLTNRDICHAKGEIACYGIMGLSFMPGNMVVTSIKRLKQNHLAEQGFKLCLHELEHAEGLPHCNNMICIMQDAKGKNIFTKVNGFCERCAGYMKKKGWSLKGYESFIIKQKINDL